MNGGASGWPALDWAAAEASARHGLLRIVHAISWPQWGVDPFGELTLDWNDNDAPQRGTMVLEQALRRAKVAAPNLPITRHLEAGEAATAIVTIGRFDTLIVVGRGRTRRPCRRSLAHTVVRLATGSVAVIRPPSDAQPNGDRR